MNLFISLVLFTAPLNDTVMLSKIITAECSICGIEEQYLVGSVVLNRIDSYKFPDTLEEVLEQDGQFVGYQSKHFVTTPHTMRIARNLMKGKNRDPIVVYFYKVDAHDQSFVNKVNPLMVYYRKHHIYAMERIF